MIYKFISQDEAELEVFLKPQKELHISIFDHSDSSNINLNKEQVYNLIGALHSLKSKM